MALSASRTMKFKMRTDPRGDIAELPVAGSTTIYAGGFVGMIATGYVQPYVKNDPASTALVGGPFIGVALEEVVNSGSAGAKTCKVLTSGAFEHAVSGLAITDVGGPVYASDDGTLSLLATSNELVGFVERFISSALGIVRLIGPTNKSLGTPMISRCCLIDLAVATNIVKIIHENENPGGMMIWDTRAIVAEAYAGTEDQGVVTLQDTSGTTLGLSFSVNDAGADAINDAVPASGEMLTTSSLGSAVVPIVAGKGVQAKVTTPTTGSATGQLKIWVLAVPMF